MGIFKSLMVALALSILASGVHGLHNKSDSPALSYWKDKLPNTPIPNTLRQLTVKGKRGDISVRPSAIGLVYGYRYDVASDAKMLSNPFVSIFVLEKDIHAGTKESLYLLKKSNGAQAHFLPRHLSDKIPFSSDKLSVALQNLNIPEGSEAALTMKDTIEQCESPAINGETKYCATSLESMIDYSTSRLGTNHVNVLVANVPKGSVKQQYTITAVPFQSKSGSKSVVCHSKAYAYAVFYCHETENTKIVKVSLKGQDGTRAEAVAVCHVDTSWWNPNFVALKLLNVKPGGPSVCHFVPEDHVVWLRAN